jgi:hypothetical protein
MLFYRGIIVTAVYKHMHLALISWLVHIQVLKCVAQVPAVFDPAAYARFQGCLSCHASQYAYALWYFTRWKGRMFDWTSTPGFGLCFYDALLAGIGSMSAYRDASSLRSAVQSLKNISHNSIPDGARPFFGFNTDTEAEFEDILYAELVTGCRISLHTVACLEGELLTNSKSATVIHIFYCPTDNAARSSGVWDLYLNFCKTCCSSSVDVHPPVIGGCTLGQSMKLEHFSLLTPIVRDSGTELCDVDVEWLRPINHVESLLTYLAGKGISLEDAMTEDQSVVCGSVNVPSVEGSSHGVRSTRSQGRANAQMRVVYPASKRACRRNH